MRIGLLLLALTSCAGSPTQPQSPPEAAPGPQVSNEVRAQLEQMEAPFHAPGTVTARLGETVRLGNVSVRPLEFLEDSRCPLDVDCVWAGRVRVKVSVSGAGEPEMEIGRPVPLPGGGTLVLTAVAPARWQSVPAGVDVSGPARFAFRLDEGAK
jgi:hypothetical protein